MYSRTNILEQIRKIERLGTDVKSLSKLNVQKKVDFFSKKINKIELDTTPVYYDLYNYNGITQAIGTAVSPTPESAYEATLISGTTYQYDFIYPIYGFVVPIGETPEDYTGGATPWTYKTTIAVVKTTMQFSEMPDWAIDGSKVVCYVSNDDGSMVGNLEFVLLAGGQDTQAITVDFSYCYRWIVLKDDDNVTTGYNFEFFAIYPIATGHKTNLYANLYFYNPKDYYVIHPTKI